MWRLVLAKLSRNLCWLSTATLRSRDCSASRKACQCCCERNWLLVFRYCAKVLAKLSRNLCWYQGFYISIYLGLVIVLLGEIAADGMGIINFTFAVFKLHLMCSLHIRLLKKGSGIDAGFLALILI